MDGLSEMSEGGQAFVPPSQSWMNQVLDTGCPWGEGVALGRESTSNTSCSSPPAEEDLASKCSDYYKILKGIK